MAGMILSQTVSNRQREGERVSPSPLSYSGVGLNRPVCGPEICIPWCASQIVISRRPQGLFIMSMSSMADVWVVSWFALSLRKPSLFFHQD